MAEQNHERLNMAVAAHLAVAMEAQEALAAVVDLNGSYQADIDKGTLTIAGRPLQVVLLGTVSKASNTWLWSWANGGFSAQVPAIAPVRRVAEIAESWGIWELGRPQFSLAEVLDTGLGAGASIALLAAPQVGATAFYSADYGTGLAYFGIVDPAVPRPAAEAVTFPRRIMAAVDLLPGHARSQLLTYASVHNLRVVGDGRQLTVHLGPDVLAVEFDDQARIVSIRGSLGAAPVQ
ncbi:DUF6882 domain-containing protein [Micropruina sp.]|uniref:DUF6882 domain-containing protein n=1 Tax=Micropruina sp. TaxID=2737536 RepID=UPI0039E30718